MIVQDGFTLFTREEFKDWLFKTSFTRVIGLLQNHHTWSPGYKDFNGSNHFAMLNGMRSYHTTPAPNGAGFSDIAQNITIFPDGKIAICRSFEKAPAGIYGVNTEALCMEIIGNFDIGGDTMNEEQKQSVIFVNALFCMKFNKPVSTESLVYHHWFDLGSGTRLDYGGTPKSGSTKTCPGTAFFGGNTVDKANVNFIPLVKAKVTELVTPVVKEVLSMFADDSKIGAWAKPSVERLVQLGLLKGDDQNNFNPQNPLTREQFAVVIDRLLKLLGK